MNNLLSDSQELPLSSMHIIPFFLSEDKYIYQHRAKRFTSLSKINTSLSSYLNLCAQICDIQHDINQRYCCILPSFSVQQRQEQQAGGVLPLDYSYWQRDKIWHEMLSCMLSQLKNLPSLPIPAQQAIQQIEARPHLELDELVDTLFKGDKIDQFSNHYGVFIIAVLQIYFRQLALQLDSHAIISAVSDHCPVCGYAACGSRLRPDSGGLRYLHCGLCETEWHYVRAICTQCHQAEGLAYYTLPEESINMTSESCASCQVYIKQLDQVKYPQADIIADDVASLALDIAMGQKGLVRAQANPFLLFSQ